MAEILPLTSAQIAGLMGQQRGLESQDNIERALKSVPYVVDVFPTNGDELYDPDGTNLIVFVDRPSVHVLYVQAKSAKKGERNFTWEFGKRMRRRGIVDISPTQGLIQESRIVLNGQLPDDQIVQIYEAKLGSIELYRSAQLPQVA